MLHSVLRWRRLKPCFPLLVMIGFLAVGGGPVAAQEWSVNKGKSSVSMQLTMDGQPVTGQFGSYRIDILFDPEEPADGKITAVIDATSIRTGDPQRDAALFSPQWLSGGAFPTIRVTSRAIKGMDVGSYRMEADLTIRGVTKRVVAPLTIDDAGDAGKVQAEIQASPADFGIGGPASGGDALSLVFDLTATNLSN